MQPLQAKEPLVGEWLIWHLSLICTSQYQDVKEYLERVLLSVLLQFDFQE